MRECFVYARVSSDRQEKEGYSIPAQLELLREYAQRHGLRVAKEYTEAETAGKTGRFQFDAMMQAVKRKGAPKVILVEKTDRLTRNFKDHILLDDLVKAHGLEVHKVKEGVIKSANASSHDRLIEDLKVVLAKNYLENLREEIKKGQRQKVKSGYWCWKAPHGYRMVDKLLQIDPEKALFVYRAFEYYAQGGVSLQSLIKRLYREGVFYLPHKPKVPKDTLYKILNNPLYIGEIHYQGQVIQAAHDPIIDRDTWVKVQGILHGKAHPKTDRSFVYKGLLTCGECGSVLNGELKKGGKYTYYRCWKSANGKRCSQKYINESLIDKAVAEVFEWIVFPPGFKKSLLAAMRDLSATKKMTEQQEMDRITREKLRQSERFEKAYLDYQEGVISKDFFLKLQGKHEEQMASLDAAYARVSKAGINYQQLAEWYFEIPEMLMELWIEGSSAVKSRLLNLTTSNFHIKNGSVDIELVPALLPLIKKPDYLKSGFWWNNANELRTFLCKHAVTIEGLYRALAA